eukprot:12924190-Prorocentrum_lima.AAC.1
MLFQNSSTSPTYVPQTIDASHQTPRSPSAQESALDITSANPSRSTLRTSWSGRATSSNFSLDNEAQPNNNNGSV